MNRCGENLFDVDIDIPADVTGFQVHDGLPIVKLPAGRSAMLIASGGDWHGGPRHFEITLRGRTADGETVKQVAFIDTRLNPMSFPIELPLDDDGYLRRQCPTCERLFKWHYGPTPQRPNETGRPGRTPTRTASLGSCHPTTAAGGDAAPRVNHTTFPPSPDG